MNQHWSELNKLMQEQLKKEQSYQEGIKTLLKLRKELMNTVLSLENEISRDDFNSMPFINAHGYHNKTIAYSLWHIFRIEDIVMHSIINDDEQIFFSKGYDNRIGASILTTGNELVKEQIREFSKELDVTELYAYMNDVKENSESILKKFSYNDLRRKNFGEKKEYLNSLHVVSMDKDAIWLIDYWCSKDVKGLIQMPCSRHWIMHIDAILRIKNKLNNG